MSSKDPKKEKDRKEKDRKEKDKQDDPKQSELQMDKEKKSKKQKKEKQKDKKDKSKIEDEKDKGKDADKKDKMKDDDLGFLLDYIVSDLEFLQLKYKNNKTNLKLKQKDEDLLNKQVNDEEIPIKKKDKEKEREREREREKEKEKEKEENNDLSQKWAMASNIIIKNPEPNSQANSKENRAPGLPLQSSTASVMQQTLALGIYEKSSSGAYKIPLNQHKNYPHAIRLYIGNLPDIFDKDDFMKFFQKQMEIAGALLEPGQPVKKNLLLNKKIVGIQPQLDKKYIFATFRSIEETTTALALDGTQYNTKVLRIRRVKDYDIHAKVEGERPIPKIDASRLSFQKISTVVNDGPLKLFVSGLAPDIEEESLIILLSQYGNLKSLHIVRDRGTNQSKGYAFCEFTTEQEVVNCLTQLNNKAFNGRTIQVKRGMPANLITADPNYKTTSQPHQIDTITIQEQQEWDIKLRQVKSSKTSSVLKLTNIIRTNEIEENNEFYFVKRDLKRELEKIGRLVNIVIPRTKDGFAQENVGKVFVEYENENYAVIAFLMLLGKQYDNKDIVAEFYDAHLFADKIY